MGETVFNTDAINVRRFAGGKEREVCYQLDGPSAAVQVREAEAYLMAEAIIMDILARREPEFWKAILEAKRKGGS